MKESGLYDSALERLSGLYRTQDATVLESELVADFVRDDLLHDERAIRRMVNEQRGLAGKILNIIDDLIAKLRGKAGPTATAELKRARELWQKAFDAAGSEAGVEAHTGGVVKLSMIDAEEYLNAGDRDNKKKREAYARGEKIILSNHNEVEEYVNKALNDESLATATYGKASKRLADEISRVSGGTIKVDDYFLELVPSDLRHAYNKHNIALMEGNVPLNKKDFYNIPKNVDEYSEVISARKLKTGDTRVTLGTRNAGENYIIIVEGVSKSRGALQFKTQFGVTEQAYFEYKKRIGTTNSRGSVSSTVPPRDASAYSSIDTVPQKADGVNSSIRKNGENDAKSSLMATNDTLREYGISPELDAERRRRYDLAQRQQRGEDVMALDTVADNENAAGNNTLRVTNNGNAEPDNA